MNKIIDKTKEQTNKLGAQFEDLTSFNSFFETNIVENLKSYGTASIDKIQETISEISNSSPTIKRAGFELIEVNMKITIPPKARAKFEFKEKIDQEKLDILLEENKNSKLISTMLQILFKATSFTSMVEKSGLKLNTVIIELSIPPKIDVTFGKDMSGILPEAAAKKKKIGPPLSDEEV